MTDENSDKAIAAELTAEGAKLTVSNKFVLMLGPAGEWLFPGKSAKARITGAMARRVADKIAAGGSLDADERHMFAHLWGQEAHRIENQEAVATKVREYLPGMATRARNLPSDNEAVSPWFFEKARAVASETTPEELRNLLALLIAGEMTSSGSVSIKTMDVMRTLEPRVAKRFCALRPYLINDRFLLLPQPISDLLDSKHLDIFKSYEEYDLCHSGIPFVLYSELIRVGIKSPDGEVHVALDELAKEALFGVRCVRLTTVGQQIASVLPFESDPSFLPLLAQGIADHVAHRGVVELQLAGNVRQRIIGAEEVDPD